MVKKDTTFKDSLSAKLGKMFAECLLFNSIELQSWSLKFMKPLIRLLALGFMNF